MYLYCYVILELLAPWTVMLPAALVGKNRFALSYFWGTFVFFTLSASRRSYYLLPILPAAAMLVAAALVRPGRLRTIGVWLFAIAVFVSPFVAVLGISWIDFWKNFPIGESETPDIPAPIALAVAWTVSAAAIAFAMRRRRYVAAALVVAAFAFEIYLFVFAWPAADAYRTQRPFAEAVRKRLGPDIPDLALYRTSDIVYYLDPPKPLPEFKKADEARDPSIRWLIVRSRDAAYFRIGEEWVAEVLEANQPWDSNEQGNAKLLLLRRIR